jgi:hypothetical protein
MFASRFALIPFAVLCNAAHAQPYLYVCNTSEGSTISGAAPPAECIGRDIRVLNPDGTVNSVIAAALTPEQRRQRDAQDEKRAAARERERFEQGLENQRDSLVLRPESDFEDLGKIEQGRQRALANQQILIDRANQRIAQCERERNFLVPETASFPEGTSDDARRHFKLYKLCIEQQENVVAAVQLEMFNINARFDAAITRHRKLREIANRSKPDQPSIAAPSLLLPATSH